LPAIGLYNPLDEVEGDIEFLLDLFNLLLMGFPAKISVEFAHLVSDVALVMALLDESGLFFEPHIEILESSYLILS
jgi:hypothetical protein